MSKTKKIVISITTIIALILLTIACIFVKNNYSTWQQKSEFKKFTLEEQYEWQNLNLGITSPNKLSSYTNPGQSNFNVNELYCALHYYKLETGTTLTIKQVEEYLSQEYEDDGSIRIYSNGKHPEIQKYFEWLFLKSINKENRNAFYSSQYVDYIETKRGEIYREQNSDTEWNSLNSELLDELMEEYDTLLDSKD